ncbi:MAG: ABC transporter permease [Alkalispirochaeta sp.]
MTSPSRRRAVLRGDLRFQWRHGFHAVYGVVLLVYLAGVMLVPPHWRSVLAGILVFSDTSVLGFFFVGSMTLLEREQRVLTILSVSPVPPRRWVTSKVLTLAGLAAGVSIPLLIAGHGWTTTLSRLPYLLPTILLSSAFYTAIGIVVALRSATLNQYFFRGALWTLVFVAPVLPAFGVLEHTLWWALPTLPALSLLHVITDVGPDVAVSLVILAAWTGGMLVLVYYRAAIELRRPEAPAAGRHKVARRAGDSRQSSRHADRRSGDRFGAVLRSEVRLILRDPLLTTVLLAPLLFLLLLRFGIPVAATLLAGHWGFDPAPYVPLLSVFFLCLIPIMLGMVSGFVLLDELDEGVLAPISVSPLHRGGWLVRKLIIVSSGTLPLVVALGRLNGVYPIPWATLAAACPALCLQTPAVALALATVARDKVEGVALSKAVGILALAPIVVWYAPGFWALAGAPIPGIWVSMALLSRLPNSPVSYGAGMTGAAGALVTCGWLWLLVRRFLARNAHGV